MSKGIPTLWEPALMAKAIRQLFRSRCLTTRERKGTCDCTRCKQLRLIVFGSYLPLKRDRRGYRWRNTKLAGMDPLPRDQSQEFIATHFDRKEVRTHPDAW